MKHKLIGGLAVAALIVALCPNPANADPIITDINLSASQDIGAITDSLSGADGYGLFTIGPITTEAGLYLSIYMVDSVAAAAAADTIVFALCRRPYPGIDYDSAQGALATDLPNGWVSVYATAAEIINATAFPITKHIPLDSLAVYPVAPGQYKWFVYGETGAPSHYMDKAYKFRAYIEYEGGW